MSAAVYCHDEIVSLQRQHSSSCQTQILQDGPPSRSVVWPTVENWSMFQVEAFVDVLKYTVNILRAKDRFSLVSEEEDIARIFTELQQLAPPLDRNHRAGILCDLADMFIQYSLVHEAYYFYFQAYSFVCVGNNVHSTPAQNCMLQIAKILRSGKLLGTGKISAQSAEETAVTIFQWLYKECKCEVASSFIFY